MTERERIRAEIWKYVSLPWPIDPAFWTDKLTDAIVAALDAGRGVGLSDEEHDYFVAALAQYGDRHGPSEIANAVLAKVTDALAAGGTGRDATP